MFGSRPFDVVNTDSPSAAQRQVERDEHVEVVAAHRVAQVLVVERERRQQLEVLDEVVGVVVERLDHRVQVLEVGGEVVLGLRQHVRRDAARSCRSAVNASTMLVRLSLSTFSAAGSVSSARPRLSLLRARMPAKRFSPSAAAMMSAVCWSSEPVSSASRGHQIGEAACAARDRGVGLVGDVLQRTEIALVDHHAERGQHLLGGRVATGAGSRDVRAVGQPALAGPGRPAATVRCAENRAARSARPSRSRSPAG